MFEFVARSFGIEEKWGWGGVGVGMRVGVSCSRATVAFILNFLQGQNRFQTYFRHVRMKHLLRLQTLHV